MEDYELRALLDLYMCSDPYPCDKQEIVENLLNQESMNRGYTGWVGAYHELEAEPA